MRREYKRSSIGALRFTFAKVLDCASLILLLLRPPRPVERTLAEMGFISVDAHEDVWKRRVGFELEAVGPEAEAELTHTYRGHMIT